MLEPQPFAFTQEDDDDQGSSDSASHPPPFLRTSQDHYDSPPFRPRVHFDDGNTNDEEIDHAPSPLPFALSSNNLDEVANNDTAEESAHDAVHAQHTAASAVQSNNSDMDEMRSTLSYHSAVQEYNHGNEHVTTNPDGPGITILDEDSESMHRQSIANSRNYETQTTTSRNIRPASSSFFQTQIIDDSIVAGAAAHVDANPNYANVSSVIGGHNGDASSILNQLMQYANNDDDDGDALPRIWENEMREEQQLSIDGNENDDDDDIIISSSSSNRRIWEWPTQFLSSLRNKKKRRQTSSNNVPTAALTNPTRPPIRAHRVRHDKYIVEVDIMPSSSSTNVDIRDAIDILANVELLHLWFEPIPAVFDACTKDGSGNNLQSSSSPRTSPANSLHSSNEDNHNYNNVRQYDGEWIEISSSLLALPSDARISSCLRATSVGIRKLIGFPARVRSMMFVERSAGRVGLTLGPYPDRLFHGTMAHHTFHLSVMAGDEEYGVGMGGQKIVIMDEVRLQREGDEVGLNGKRNGYCYCALFRVFFALFEWITVLWYQPDLASYMAQTISSMEKLRTLIERGESAAHAGGELVMEADDWESGDGVDTSMQYPLLG
ncbi:hypothetical protein QTG54_007854 [Skeletonema marinoi]|uniref:Uncharacterized protein n=1 Tax=Skeletonema marinoi TaxID=267567 RepID=A0AAD8Y9R2_9STRA|nr:hypothetical protein QTG54_007854 [Skeletonema marinoi]